MHQALSSIGAETRVGVTEQGKLRKQQERNITNVRKYRALCRSEQKYSVRATMKRKGKYCVTLTVMLRSLLQFNQCSATVCLGHGRDDQLF